ncbi:muscle M-line assembly protein unc-89 isoform X3 [Procambarus clarkii]|uniref:muscle M-line assembly protein unc-89 isoform X3 n=1 Tax=Procambarus clarkii TaxID=6728 RepID=UPI003743297D
MLSYMLPVEEKVSFSEGDASSFTPLSDDRSPVSETKPLLGDEKSDKLASMGDPVHLESPSTEEAKLIMEEKEKEKPQDPDMEMVDLKGAGSDDRSPAASDDKSVFSETLASPGSDDRSIIKTSASAKPSLKRVSFGSSKGSMVETLIYDSPVAEEERIPEEDDPPFRDPVSQKFGCGVQAGDAYSITGLTTETGSLQKPASKVRVTFYESSKPLVVTSPEPSEFDQYFPQDLIMASPVTDGITPAFDRQLSSDSGRDNPFRPDGDISREADEIVQLIKSGRPLQGQPGQRPGDLTDSIDGIPSSPTDKDAVAEPLVSQKDASPQQQQHLPQQQHHHHEQQQPTPVAVPSKPVTDTTPSSPGKAGANGSAAPENSTPGTVEVTHATVTPTDAAHVEHVVIKKKSKCNCCVIQ